MYYNIVESGERIRKLRENKGISRAVLAEKVSLSTDAVRKIERGTNGGKIDTLVLLAEYFGVSLDYLVCGCMQKERQESGIFAGLRENEVKFIQKTVENLRADIICLRE